MTDGKRANRRESEEAGLLYLEMDQIKWKNGVGGMVVMKRRFPCHEFKEGGERIKKRDLFLLLCMLYRST